MPLGCLTFHRPPLLGGACRLFLGRNLPFQPAVSIFLCALSIPGTGFPLVVWPEGLYKFIRALDSSLFHPVYGEGIVCPGLPLFPLVYFPDQFLFHQPPGLPGWTGAFPSALRLARLGLFLDLRHGSSLLDTLKKNSPQFEGSFERLHLSVGVVFHS
ncbi:hypothetical protein ADH75_16410 [Flavonifractor plautii]|nr:hypothetical protein A4U99_07800 [Flavonifractor plautii]OXE45129.1 hypothetical protein ADH75_16410 [Flavonifractor plautii]